MVAPQVRSFGAVIGEGSQGPPSLLQRSRAVQNPGHDDSNSLGNERSRSAGALEVAALQPAGKCAPADISDRCSSHLRNRETQRMKNESRMSPGAYHIYADGSPALALDRIYPNLEQRRAPGH